MEATFFITKKISSYRYLLKWFEVCVIQSYLHSKILQILAHVVAICWELWYNCCGVSLMLFNS